jgi:phosphomannomutase
MLHIYATAKQTGKTFSQLVAPYQRYTQTEDVIVPVSDQPAALAAAYEFLMKRQPIKVKKFDGWFFDFGEVWGSVKISVTEPALKMMFEGKQKKVAQVLQDELAEFVRTLS